jgi:hypothetical protein
MTMTLEMPDELMLGPDRSGSKPSVMSYAGIFRDSREESARIMETIEAACEQIQPEDWK